MKQFSLMAVGIILILVALACNFPALIPTTPNQPTPDLTMTALFSSGILGSLTAPPTFPPTLTSLPPTVTFTIEEPTHTLTPATPTLTYTISPPPTVEITPLNPGSRPAVVANYLWDSPPTLDGDWGEWTATEYGANSVVFGASRWSGPADLSSSFKIGWDAKNLYIAAKIKDDVYVQTSTGQSLYKGDEIELQIDTNVDGDFYLSQLNSDDYQLGNSAGRPDVNGFKEAVLYFPKNLARTLHEVQIGSKAEPGIYRIEFAVPWTVLNITPVDGMRLGFVLCVSDNDLLSQNVQQSMVCNVPGRKLTNPRTWGDLILHW
jgi:hypothetical protein